MIEVSSSPFRKSMSQLRSSGSKSQREGSAAATGQGQTNQCINFFAASNSLSQSKNHNNSFTETLPNPAYNILPTGNQGYIQQQQALQQVQQQPSLRSARNNSENRISTANTASVMSTINSSIPANPRANQMIRNHSNFSATPSKKKEQENQPMTAMMCPSGYPPSSKPSGNASGMPKSSQSSAVGSSSKPNINSSIFSNSFAKENISGVMHKHSASSALVGLNNSTNINNASKNGIIAAKGQNSYVSPNFPLPSSSQTGYLNQTSQASQNNGASSTSLSPNAKNFYHNILNSSWKVNMMQPSQTPRKAGDSSSNSATKPTISTNASKPYLKPQSRPYFQDNLTDKSNSHIQAHSPLHGSSPVSAHNNSHSSQFNNNANTNNSNSNGRLNTSVSSSSRAPQNEETKRLKLEIEQFKNREIKYLVRIATLEKEAKKLSEQLEKSDSNNREISEENLRIRKMNSFHQNQSSSHYNNSSLQGSSNLTQSIDEQQRSMRQKTDPFEGCCQQCGGNSQLQKLQAGSSGSAQGSNPQNFGSYNKYKLKYAQLRQQHKDILRQCIEKETENAELRAETLLARQLLSNPLENQQLSNSSKSTVGLDCSGSEMPSFVKALSLGQHIGSMTGGGVL